MKWYLEVWKKYAVFSGRARRKEYWMFVLFNLIVAFAIGFVTGLIGALTGSVISSVANLVYSLAIAVPSVAVGVRRMHDIGRSGWWLLVPVVSLVFVCLDSQPGDNQYGPNPKAVPAGHLAQAA